MNRYIRISLAVTALALAVPAAAVDIPVSSAAEITTALQSANPGDVLVMQNGTWTNQVIEFEGHGTAANPITLRAETPGQVILTGSSRLEISGSHLVADGLHFKDGALSSGHVVRFRGDLGDATHSRLTNSAITDYNPADINTRYFWVSMHGNNNRVDHNTFDNQNHSGVTVTVWRDDSSRDDHRIDANYFAGRPVGNGNGFETIRIGTSQQSLSDSGTVVENNLFEEVNGEIEAISVKAGDNQIRYNTFRRTSATVTLRHGNDNTVDGNFFLGENVSGSGGVRIIGERQTIVNNYLQDLDGRANGGLVLTGGVPNSQPNEYFQVKDAVIAHNTIVNISDAAIKLDDGIGSSGRTLLPEDVTIANNLIYNAAPSFEGAEGSGFTWEGNIAFGGSLGIPSRTGISEVDPELVQGADGLYRPGPTSPAINNAAAGYSAIAPMDMDGQARIGLFDVGADEVSSAQIVRKPLEAGDVGASWLDLNGPPDPGTGPGPGPGQIDGAGYVALYAESFTNRTDPNGDGDTWNLTTIAGTLGNQAISAPPGDRVDLPAETHDALVTYDLTFDEVGTYTSYFRAYGIASNADSFFRADAFDQDPDITETTTSDATWRWETGSTFEITEAMLGMPLELRLGKREQLTSLDAVVFALDGALTDAELDALFTVVAIAGDYNDDGSVDQGDLDLVLLNWGEDTSATGVPAGWVNEQPTGLIGQTELDGVLLNWGNTAEDIGAASVPEPGPGLVLLATTFVTRRLRTGDRGSR